MRDLIEQNIYFNRIISVAIPLLRNEIGSCILGRYLYSEMKTYMALVRALIIDFHLSMNPISQKSTDILKLKSK